MAMPASQAAMMEAKRGYPGIIAEAVLAEWQSACVVGVPVRLTDTLNTHRQKTMDGVKEAAPTASMLRRIMPPNEFEILTAPAENCTP
jgi:hypothetical protein